MARVGRQKYPSERFSERLYPAPEVQAAKHLQAGFVHFHAELFIQVDQSRVEGAVICRRQGYPVSGVVDAARCADRYYVCGIDKVRVRSGCQAPELAIVVDTAGAFEELLSAAHVVLPSLPKIYTANYAVD